MSREYRETLQAFSAPPSYIIEPMFARRAEQSAILYAENVIRYGPLCQGITQFYLPPTRLGLSTNGMNHTCLCLPAEVGPHVPTLRGTEDWVGLGTMVFSKQSAQTEGWKDDVIRRERRAPGRLSIVDSRATSQITGGCFIYPAADETITALEHRASWVCVVLETRSALTVVSDASTDRFTSIIWRTSKWQLDSMCGTS